MGSRQPVSLALPIPAPSPLFFSPAQELLRKGLSSVTQERQTNESPRCWTLTRTTCLLWPATPQARAGAPARPAARVLLLVCFPQNFNPRRGFVTHGRQDGWWLYSEPRKLIPRSSKSQMGIPGGQPPVLHATVLSTRLVPSPGPCSLHTGRPRSPGPATSRWQKGSTGKGVQCLHSCSVGRSSPWGKGWPRLPAHWSEGERTASPHRHPRRALSSPW